MACLSISCGHNTSSISLLKFYNTYCVRKCIRHKNVKIPLKEILAWLTSISQAYLMCKLHRVEKDFNSLDLDNLTEEVIIIFQFKKCRRILPRYLYAFFHNSISQIIWIYDPWSYFPWYYGKQAITFPQIFSIESI